MTTNSPNPVDGDVQALIEYCQRVLHGSNNGSQMEQVYQIALAALTAEPCAYLYGSSFERGEVEGEVDDSPGTDTPVYTIQPAQLLRPVDLPHAYSPALSSVLKNATDGVAVMRCDKNGRWINKTAVIEALRQQGYEVKS